MTTDGWPHERQEPTARTRGGRGAPGPARAGQPRGRGGARGVVRPAGLRRDRSWPRADRPRRGPAPRGASLRESGPPRVAAPRRRASPWCWRSSRWRCGPPRSAPAGRVGVGHGGAGRAAAVFRVAVDHLEPAPEQGTAASGRCAARGRSRSSVSSRSGDLLAQGDSGAVAALLLVTWTGGTVLVSRGWGTSVRADPGRGRARPQLRLDPYALLGAAALCSIAAVTAALVTSGPGHAVAGTLAAGARGGRHRRRSGRAAGDRPHDRLGFLRHAARARADPVSGRRPVGRASPGACPRGVAACAA